MNSNCDLGLISTVNGVIFAPCNFRPLHLQTVLPRLEFAHTQLCLKRDDMGIEFAQS